MAKPQPQTRETASLQGDVLPDGWAYVALQEVTLPVANMKPEDEPRREFRYVDISSISNHTQQITECKTFKGADAPSRARRPIKVGDVLFSNVRTYLRNIALVTNEVRADVCSHWLYRAPPERGDQVALPFVLNPYRHVYRKT